MAAPLEDLCVQSAAFLTMHLSCNLHVLLSVRQNMHQLQLIRSLDMLVASVTSCGVLYLTGTRTHATRSVLVAAQAVCTTGFEVLPAGWRLSLHAYTSKDVEGLWCIRN
jgi:hypothetical protein